MAHKALADSSVRTRSRERNIGSQGSWPLAHSSESVGKRERLAHKASDLDKTLLTTGKHALTVLNTALACFNTVKHFLSQNV